MTSALLTEALGPLRANPQRGAVLLDIDGTLSPIVERAADARVSEPMRQLLIEVARRYGTVACVSGRSAGDARAMVAIGSISYLGMHGVELLRAGWNKPVLAPEVQQWVREVQAFARLADTPELRRLRVRIEDKGPIVAFHWRGAPDGEAALAAVQRVADSASQAGLRTHWGRKVLEVRPPVRIDKGVGIRAFLEGADVDVALYAGDDRTDLDAFRTLAELAEEGRVRGAIRVGVHSDEGPAEITEEADVVVEGTEGVHELLAALIAD